MALKTREDAKSEVTAAWRSLVTQLRALKALGVPEIPQGSRARPIQKDTKEGAPPSFLAEVIVLTDDDIHTAYCGPIRALQNAATVLGALTSAFRRAAAEQPLQLEGEEKEE